MKKIKKILITVLVLTFVFIFETAAFAAETVDNQTTHNYEAYQIFAGTQAQGDTAGKLAVTDWGTGINGEAFLAALKSDSVLGSAFASASDARAVAEILAAHPEYADTFAALAHQYKTGIPQEIHANTVTIELTAGYYLLVDTTDVAGTGDAKNISLLQVTRNGSVTIKQKYSVPTVEKKVRDINDTDDAEAGGWLDSADHDIGDSVSFRLTGTLPSNLDDYDTYFYQFSDTLSAGLTYNNDAKVFLINAGQRTEITDSFDLSGAPASIKCDNIKAIAGVEKDSEIAVEYTAVLNVNAVIGSAGNPNSVYLEFSNNPNAGGEGEHGKTPSDLVKVFTYNVVVNKTDEQHQALPGAEFTLFKKLNGGTEKEITAVKDTDGTVFTFKGLDDGTYILRETKAPDGYNKVADIEFTVAAEHETESSDPVLISLTGTTAAGDITFTPDLANGSLNTDIVNKSGATLPETGGIGTTCFYILGGVLVIAAGILLLIKRRKNAFIN